MRVISGSAGGISLSVPERVVRPTMDKVRAAIFSSLGDAVPGARVLDLFAGSGAFGIEALSRGAESAVFVDTDRQAAECVLRNLRKCKLAAASVQTMDVFRFLKTYAHPGAYDLVFADPPYRKAPGDTDFAGPLLASAELAASLPPHGTFVLETLATESLPSLAGTPWRLLRSRTYGESGVHYLTVAA
ncbi:MAG: 16S rRNA (guanine(966)-N(2))-methyltransferase RsmD [Terrimicrobiaceae bacterium]|nr:16S rRNA (guanine(966)-N(2))-methyltransferase RsmD [Terrimicrobiaceae bacterium]